MIILPIGKIHRQFKDAEGNVHVGISFSDKKDIYRERLFEYLFVDVPAMQLSLMEQRTTPQTLSTIQNMLRNRLPETAIHQLLEDTMQ
jgi:hypothetical protein